MNETREAAVSQQNFTLWRSQILNLHVTIIAELFQDIDWISVIFTLLFYLYFIVKYGWDLAGYKLSI